MAPIATIRSIIKAYPCALYAGGTDIRFIHGSRRRGALSSATTTEMHVSSEDDDELASS